MEGLEAASARSAQRATETGYSLDVATEIADICADASISLVASLPDDWIAQTIARFEQDPPLQPCAGQPGRIGHRAVFRCVFVRYRLGGADGRIGANDPDLCHHQDQLHL